MKILTTAEMQRIERGAIEEGACAEAFMDKAGEGIAQWIVHHFPCRQFPRILLLCGKGNNAGDAYVAGALLAQQQYQVTALALFEKKACSPLCQKKQCAFEHAKGTVITLPKNATALFSRATLLIDGLLGTGFSGTLSSPFEEIIRLANDCPAPSIAIDIPSGLDGTSGTVHRCAIRATATVTLGFPKIGCFKEEGWNHVGQLLFIDFGLPLCWQEKAVAQACWIQREEILPLLPPLVRNRHKYQAGEVLAIAGWGKMWGAAHLATKAALQSGAGIARLFTPPMSRLPSFFPELITETYCRRDFLVRYHDKKQCALLLGPGMGKTTRAQYELGRIIEAAPLAMVIDADALFAIGNSSVFPRPTVLTPHRGEAARLFGLDNPEESVLLASAKQFAEQYGVAFLLKGGPSYLFTPDGRLFIQTHGHPGMATAGSGDVLSGIIAALLSQDLTACDAAMAGSFLHGVAGEKAAQRVGPRSMMASDLSDFLPHAFAQLGGEVNRAIAFSTINEGALNRAK